MQFIRSLIFYAAFWVSVIIASPIALFARLFSLKACRHVSIAWTKLATYLAKWICGVSWHVSRETPTGPKVPVIYLAKHQSTWETLFLRWYLPDAAWVAKKELAYLPFFGWAMAATKPIYLDRSKGKEAYKKLLAESAKRVAAGESIVIFPEGTRQRDLDAEPIYKSGGIRIAKHLNIPIIPISHNAGYFWPAKSFILQKGCVALFIHKEVSTENQRINDLEELVKATIEAKVSKPRDVAS